MMTGRPLGFTALFVGLLLAGIAYHFWEAPSVRLADSNHGDDKTMRYISALFGRGH
jgi:hypothetical protein